MRVASKASGLWASLLMSLFAPALVLATATVALAEPRYALVIGNSGYKSARLPNPKNDAKLIARTLQQLGFKVTKLIDVDQRAMKKAMLAFSRRLRKSDAIGLFYYAGHAVQVDGENYLIPIGANIIDESEVPVEGLSLNQMFKTMERAESRVNIAILDACRDNPFATGSRSLTRGLAPVLAPTGSFIGFATAPGQVAYDGAGSNSPYSGALAEAMLHPGITIEEVFRRTRRKVLAATGGKQTPWESTSLTGPFFFKQKPATLEANKPKVGSPAAVLSPQQLSEWKAWRHLQGEKTLAGYEAFIKAHPGGMFEELARVKLANLEAGRGDDGQTEAARNSSEAAGEEDADNLAGWAVSHWLAPAQEKVLTAKERAAVVIDLADAALRKKDYTKALELYAEAAKLGAPVAMYNLAKLYDGGRGVTRSLKLSASWYRAAADLGHARSMSALGNMYEFGEGVDKDLANALRFYQMAAEAGDPNGMTSLAFLYSVGKGVARDHKLARKWYRVASEKGNARAMFNLALMEIRGEGGSVDYSDAARWLKKAVAKGHSGAMRQLASLYEAGKGVVKMPRKSADLLLRSYKAGNTDTRNDLFVRPETWSRATRRLVQKGLRRKGVYRGPTNGVIGRLTRKALLTYSAKK